MTEGLGGDDGDPLAPILGKELAAVVFHRHYIQLAFDGPLLNIDARSTVRISGRGVSAGQAGFRDALCERIGLIVTQAYVCEDVELGIAFGDGSTLTVPLTHEEKPQAAEFRNGFDLWVW